jgi:hypothetical protein
MLPVSGLIFENYNRLHSMLPVSGPIFENYNRLHSMFPVSGPIFENYNRLHSMLPVSGPIFENYNRLHSMLPVSGPIFETMTARIQSRHATQSTTRFIYKLFQLCFYFTADDREVKVQEKSTAAKCIRNTEHSVH